MHRNGSWMMELQTQMVNLHSCKGTIPPWISYLIDVDLRWSYLYKSSSIVCYSAFKAIGIYLFSSSEYVEISIFH